MAPLMFLRPLVRRGSAVLAAFLVVDIARAQVDIPTAANFLRRGQHGSVALGDFVYIEGGQIAQLIDGQPDNITARNNNKTISIDMRTSWTNETVQMNAIDKGSSPQLSFPTPWPDASNDCFYLWSGETLPGLSVPALGIWKFSADGAGGGAWAQEAVQDTADFDKLTRPVGGYGTTTTSGAGWYAGGYATSRTDFAVDVSGQMPVPGIVSFNFTTGGWTNASATGLSTYGTAVWGQAQEVPFGSDGLLVLLGGESGSRTTVSNQAGLLDFNTVTIYDPSSSTWYSQAATGSAPSQRDGFCMVGAQGTNGSFELFVYGGWNAFLGETYNDTYVLSLPAFRWFAGPTADPPRLDHTCEVVGSGKRQFLAIGGTNNNLPNSERWTDADPWRQGLGVFDMTDMSWSGGYDADASAYESPQVVKDWYNSGNGEPTWTSDTVKALFEMTAAHSTTTSPTTSPTTSSTSTNTSAPSSASSAHKTSPGAIAGGVVGGLAALALVGGLLIWVAVRRRRRRRREPEKPSPNELVSRAMFELPAEQAKLEMPGDGVNEMPTDHRYKELPGQDGGDGGTGRLARGQGGARSAGE